MGYILEGKYYEGSPPSELVNPPVQSTYADWSRDRQREDHKIDLIQPYKNGKPNEDFIEYYPEESKDYGFIKEQE